MEATTLIKKKKIVKRRKEGVVANLQEHGTAGYLQTRCLPNRVQQPSKYIATPVISAQHLEILNEWHHVPAHRRIVIGMNTIDKRSMWTSRATSCATCGRVSSQPIFFFFSMLTILPFVHKKGFVRLAGQQRLTNGVIGTFQYQLQLVLSHL